MVDSITIKVGGDDRWSDSIDYVSWASQYNFTVGDVLVFSYTPTRHNVYEVTKTTFQSCNTSTGVDAKYSSGNDEIVLKEAKPYWFVCTVDDHCRVGMKLAVNVTAASTNITPSPPPATSSENSASTMLTTAMIFLVSAGFLSILALIG
ncbi:basic blue protein-like [Silene latifolia]|uniref:basic blue protein-like n=1 Tax=Silene latifolia TaxID=37657 RepID=UPI003D78800B